jgi:peptidoglycan/xylan/chitin deacetylase (PgdA/CDA1 family)
MTSMTNEEAFAELYYSKKAIHDVIGITVSCWRPPYGDVDDRIRFIADQLGMRTIIWDNDTDDWNYGSIGVKGVEANYKKIMNGDYRKHGTIVLSHEVSCARSTTRRDCPR